MSLSPCMCGSLSTVPEYQSLGEFVPVHMCSNVRAHLSTCARVSTCVSVAICVHVSMNVPGALLSQCWAGGTASQTVASPQLHKHRSQLPPIKQGGPVCGPATGGKGMRLG